MGMSIYPKFFVSSDKDSKAIVYEVVGDLIGRKFSIKNSKCEIVAQITKTNTAMLQTAVFGSGAESVIDIAPGVDCSTILVIVFALGQVGAHYLKDAFLNFVTNPLKSHVVDSTIDVVGDIATGENLGDAAAEFAEDITFGMDDGLVDAVEIAAEEVGEVAGDLADFFLSLLG